MQLAKQLKSKIDEKLSMLAPNAVEKFDLEEKNFKDIFLYVGQVPKTVIEVIDVEKKIYLGKDS